MSRVAPMTKLSHRARSISFSAQAAHSYGLLNPHSRYLPRSLRDLKSECNKRQLKTSGKKSELVDRLVAHDLIRSHSTNSGYRPSLSSAQNVIRTGALMQGFRTSAPVQVARDRSTIDFFYFPDIDPPAPDNLFQKLRVPLLPDNYAPNRSALSNHAIDSPDEALTRPEVVVVASHPGDVLPAALTEVVGNEGQERGIEELIKPLKSGVKETKEPSVIKQIWDGLMDDIFGPKTPKTAA